MQKTLILIAFLCALVAGCHSTPITPPGRDPVLDVPLERVTLSHTDTSFTIPITNVGGYFLCWKAESNVDWLAVRSDTVWSTTNTDSLSVRVDRTNLPAGTYNGAIVVHQLPNGNTDTVKVRLRLDEAQLVVTTEWLDFGTDQDTLMLQIHNAGIGALNWSIWSASYWISTIPTRGQIRGDTLIIEVVAARDSLAPGKYSGELIIDSNGGAQNVSVSIQNGWLLWEDHFDDANQFLQTWDVWDEDSSAQFGADYWGVVTDAQRNSSVAWCNGMGSFSGIGQGYDGGMRSYMRLRSESRINVNQSDLISVKFQMKRDFGSDSTIARVAINGVGGFVTEAWTTSTVGWEGISYDFNNPQHFLQPVDIQFVFISPLPVTGHSGFMVDDVEVWVK